MQNFNIDFFLNYQIIYVSINFDVFAICCLFEFAFNLFSKSSHKFNIVFRKSSYANVNKYNIFLLCQLFIIDFLLI